MGSSTPTSSPASSGTPAPSTLTPNIKIILQAIDKLKLEPQPTSLAQTNYPLTFPEYIALLELRPYLGDLRRIKEVQHRRIEYLYIQQQLVIMPSAGERHELVVQETVDWIRSFVTKQMDNTDTLSQKGRDTWQWYKSLKNFGSAPIRLDVSHSPDASLGALGVEVYPLVIEVADSQSSENLSHLAEEYLNYGKGLIKYVFAVDIQDKKSETNVDLKIWKYRKVRGKHSNVLWRLYPLVRATGTKVDTTPSVSFYLSEILGPPPLGCEDLKVVLLISKLIKNLTEVLSLPKKPAQYKSPTLDRTPGSSVTPTRARIQKQECEAFYNFTSDSDSDDDDKHPTFQPSPESPPAS